MRFNEAAGIPRGRHSGRSGPLPRSTPRFNEAAGIPRGRRMPGAPPRRGRCRFNEAAGIPRGRLHDLEMYHEASLKLQ